MDELQLMSAGTHLERRALTRQIESGPPEAFFLHVEGQQSTMRDEFATPAADPQIAHNLSLSMPRQPVDKLWMKITLWPCNELLWAAPRVDAPGFLPTMKLQLSQLP